MPFKTKEQKAEYDKKRQLTLDKTKVKESRQKYYLANKEKMSASSIVSVERRLERKRAIVSLAKDNPCMDCGEKYHPYAMDFDHRESSEKRANVSALLTNRCATDSDVLAEIAKCDLVCSNCHRLRTFKRRGVDNYSELLNEII